VEHCQEFYQLLGDRLPPQGWQDIQWTNPGGWEVLDVTRGDVVGGDRAIPPNDASVDATPRLRGIIDSVAGRRVLYFPAGTYYLSSKLWVTDGDLILRGAGLDRTELRFTAAGPDAGIEFTGPEQGEERAVQGSPARGDHLLSVGDGGIGPGDFLLVYNRGAEQTPAGYVDWRPFAEDIFYTQCQIVRVMTTQDEGLLQKLGVDMALGLDYGNNPKCRKLTMLQNVGVERMKVSLSDMSGNPRFVRSSMVTLRKVFNGFIRDVEVDHTYGCHTDLVTCRDCVVERNRIHRAYHFAGGYGYGVLPELGATRCRVTGNLMWKCRHHILLHSGANHCVVSYNCAVPPSRTTGDIIFHGFDPHNNLIEGNRGYILKQDQRSEEDWHCHQGMYNVFFRNLTTSWEPADLVDGERYFGARIGNWQYPDFHNGHLLLMAPRAEGNWPAAHTTVIGNALGGWGPLDADDTLMGANQIGGQVEWGDIGPDVEIPRSLYAGNRPAELRQGDKEYEWPPFGPDRGGWGRETPLPAEALGTY